MAMFPGVQDYIVGGGDIQAQQGLQALDIARMMEQQRQQIGQSMLGYLTDIQRDPFSVVGAMKAYGASGGGTLAPSAALSQSGGAGSPSPYGEIHSRLLRGLSEFAGATPVNPSTGKPMTPKEMDYLRKVTGGDILRRGGTEQQAAVELARSEGDRQGLNPDIYNLPSNIAGTQWPTGGGFGGIQEAIGGGAPKTPSRPRPKPKTRLRPRRRPKSKYTSQIRKASSS